MPADGILNAARLGIIEEAARAMLTLIADLYEAAFARSRLTLPAVRRHALTIPTTATSLSPSRRA